tara:strand:+ start:2389 stop:2547 length:159 start_codon:yes stop_codon:yes gene_type:complete
MTQTIEWKKDKLGYYIVAIEKIMPRKLRFNAKLNQQQSQKLLEQYVKQLEEA